MTDQLVSNILEFYHQANPKQVSAGLRWYSAAHNFALQLSRDYGRSLPRTVALIASLSPRCKWDRNQTLAIRALRGQPLTGSIAHNRRRAAAVLTADDPATPLTSPKVRSFYHNILSAGTDNHVSVDTWAGRAALNDLNATIAIKEPEYRRIERAYIAAAEQVKLHPPQLQAIVWLVARGTDRVDR